MPFSPRDKESIYDAVKNSDVVINLIGKHYETKHIVPTRRADGNLSRVNYDFEEVNVTIPRVLAEISKEAGVSSFIHVSALSADLESKSRWSRTKAEGEIAVREAFPDSVSSNVFWFIDLWIFILVDHILNYKKKQIIVKPATIFGPEDRFLNWIAQTNHRFPFFPLLNNGQTLVQPIHSIDVGKALMAIVDVSVICWISTILFILLCVWVRVQYIILAFYLNILLRFRLSTLLTELRRVRRQDLPASRPRRVHLQGGRRVRVRRHHGPQLAGRCAGARRLGCGQLRRAAGAACAHCWSRTFYFPPVSLFSPVYLLWCAPPSVFNFRVLYSFLHRKYVAQVAQMMEDVLPRADKDWLTMADLDIQPASMDRVAFEFLHRFRTGGHFRLAKGYH